MFLRFTETSENWTEQTFYYFRAALNNLCNEFSRCIRTFLSIKGSKIKILSRFVL